MQGLVIRAGEISDLAWVCELLREGAKEGHFLPTMTNQAEVLIKSIINNGGVSMIKLRGKIQAPRFIRMDLIVMDVDGNPASFIVTCKEKNELEIHLAGTLKPYRRRGYFRNLIQWIIKNSNKSRIYSRCFKKSSWAINGLKSLGFKTTKVGEPIELSLIPPKKYLRKRPFIARLTNIFTHPFKGF